MLNNILDFVRTAFSYLRDPRIASAAGAAAGVGVTFVAGGIKHFFKKRRELRDAKARTLSKLNVITEMCESYNDGIHVVKMAKIRDVASGYIKKASWKKFHKCAVSDFIVVLDEVEALISADEASNKVALALVNLDLLSRAM